MQPQGLLVITLEELEKVGGRMLPGGDIQVGDTVFTQSKVLSSDPLHIYDLARKYANFGIKCLIVEYGGILTLWRGVKTDRKVEEKRPVVVCIDDSPLEGMRTRKILDKFNCRTVVVTKVIEAVPIVLRMKPDLVLLDICMPIVNGYEICAQLRRAEILKEMPIVMVTSSNSIVDRARAKLVGASGFLTKPVQEEEMWGTLRQFLERSEIISPY